jgi:hypothetical protein
MKEITVEQYLVSEFKRFFPDGQIHKYEIRRGEPDRILLLPKGVCMFVETKRPGEDLRKAQVRAFKRLKLLGFECHMCDTKSKVDLLINYIGMKFYAANNVLF